MNSRNHKSFLIRLILAQRKSRKKLKMKIFMLWMLNLQVNNFQIKRKLNL